MKVVLALEKIADKLVDLVNKGVNDLTVGKPEVCCTPTASTRHLGLHCDCVICDVAACHVTVAVCRVTVCHVTVCHVIVTVYGFIVAVLAYSSCGRTVCCSTSVRSSTS